MTIEQITTGITTIIVSLTAFVAAVSPAWLKLRKHLRLLAGRRSMRVTILAGGEHVDSAASYADRLRATGFDRVAVTGSSAGVALCEDGSLPVVVLWRPAADAAAGQLAQIRELHPTSTVLVYAPDTRLPFFPDDRTLISQSRVRLHGDMVALAELSA